MKRDLCLNYLRNEQHNKHGDGFQNMVFHDGWFQCGLTDVSGIFLMIEFDLGDTAIGAEYDDDRFHIREVPGSKPRHY